MRLDRMDVTLDHWPLRQPFRFAGFNVAVLDTVTVTVAAQGKRGWGEGVAPVVFDITAEQAATELEGLRSACLSGDALAACASLPPGPARNALDCALWDLRAKLTGESIWHLAGLAAGPAALTVDQSIGLASPEAMAAAAQASNHAVLKLKMDQTLVPERLAAVRAARPDAEIIIDANQSWPRDFLESLLPALARLGIAMIEQPVRRGADETLRGLQSPIAIFADESCHTSADLPRLAPLYQGVNIKLDKTGGLTEALALAHAARAHGLGLMVGCMAGTSLSMAPAYVIASLCRWADLDGPLLIAHDRAHPMRYAQGQLQHFAPALWG